jgi:hypothetical protein
MDIERNFQFTAIRIKIAYLSIIIIIIIIILFIYPPSSCPFYNSSRGAKTVTDRVAKSFQNVLVSNPLSTVGGPELRNSDLV